MPIRSFIITLALVFLSIDFASAQTCCSGGVPLSANIGLPASDKGNWQFSLNFDNNVLRTLKTGNETLNDRLRERVTNSVLLETGYGLTDKLSLDVFISLVEQQRTIFTAFGNNQTVTRGLGDAVILLKYNLLSKSTFSNWQVGIGPKLPTGSTDKRSTNGLALPADLQPGSGSWDLVLWSNYIFSLATRPTTSLFITSALRATGANNDYLGSIRYEFGNEFQLIAGITDRHTLFSSLLIDTSLSFRYRLATRDTNNGTEIEATGGEWLFITPQVSTILSTKLSANISLELPLMSFVNNTQLTPTNRITLGVFFKLNKSTNL
ncbi:MAG: hypothetical protein AAFQ94_11865 [Bacteroidota bacterium]